VSLGAVVADVGLLGVLVALPLAGVPSGETFEAADVPCVTSWARDWNAFANAEKASGLRAWIRLAS